MSEQDKERIHKDAIKYVTQATGHQVLPEHNYWMDAYIAGANTEHERMAELLKQKRKDVIDECIAAMKLKGFDPEDYNGEIALRVLESLKLKSE